MGSGTICFLAGPGEPESAEFSLISAILLSAVGACCYRREIRWCFDFIGEWKRSRLWTTCPLPSFFGVWHVLFLANEVYSACLYFDFLLILLLGDQRACLWLIVLLMVLTSSHCALVIVSRGGLWFSRIMIFSSIGCTSICCPRWVIEYKDGRSPHSRGSSHECWGGIVAYQLLQGDAVLGWRSLNQKRNRTGQKYFSRS